MFFAAMGIPGCGKSSIVSAMAGLVDIHCFVEPEESTWPEAVTNRDRVGYLTAITWFRSIRVPQLYQADELRRNNERVIVDSYYDKLLKSYLGQPGLEWLIPQSDLYFPIIQQLAALDYSLLPDADVVISFEVDEQAWRDMLGKRNRNLDRDSKLSTLFQSQALYLKAAADYCASRSIPNIKFKNELDGVTIAAKRLLKQVQDAGLL